MQGWEIGKNRIGMHVQNREFKNTRFLSIWVFGSQELEHHGMQRSMVRLSQTTRSVQPLWQSHVDLSVIGWPVRILWLTWLSEEGKKILGVWRWSPRYCSAVMQSFVVGADPVSCTTPRLKQDKRDNVNLSGILIASPIDDVKYITTKC